MTNEISIDTEIIKLDQLLKLIGIAQTGGHGKFLIKSGEVKDVVEGQTIGTMGQSGTTNPHLHYEIQVKDLPKIWNDKYAEYLGIRPENDREGVLQDVHWAGGSFGYFPSYALGYMYAAQFKQAMIKDLPNFDELLSSGDVEPIKQWMVQHVHQHGKMKKPLEILQETTGEGLNAQYLIDYLTEKYSDIYSLDRVN